MHRLMLGGLSAVVAAVSIVSAAQAAMPAAAPAQAQPFRKLAFSRIGPWEVAAIGNDEKVNHCALTRGTSSAALLPGEPKFTLIADKHWTILRVRSIDYQFTERKALAVTVVTPDGKESTPLAASGGPDLADIRFGADERDAILSTDHLVIRMGASTVRLSFADLGAAKGALTQCMANIGSPAKGWSNAEIDQLVKAVKRGEAACTQNTRTGVTMCDVDR